MGKSHLQILIRRAEQQGPQRRQTNLVPTEPLQRRNYTTRGSSPLLSSPSLSSSIILRKVLSYVSAKSRWEYSFFINPTHTQHSTSCKLQTEDGVSNSRLIHLTVKIDRNMSCSDIVHDVTIVLEGSPYYTFLVI